MPPAQRRHLPPLAAATALPIALGGVLLHRILRPASADPATADAVVVLAGGRGERLDRALELMDRGVAPTLVVSAGNPRWRGWERVRQLSAGRQAYEVVRFVPDPDNTRGEAAAAGAIARARGWRTLVLVTSSYHLARGSLHLRRCTDGPVLPVAAPARVSASAVLHEALGLVHAHLVGRRCIPIEAATVPQGPEAR